MAKVSCLVLANKVTLPTEKQGNIGFDKGEVLMIMFHDEDTTTDYLVCSAGGNIPFVWVAKNHQHKVIEMELDTWKKQKKDRIWHKYAMNLGV